MVKKQPARLLLQDGKEFSGFTTTYHGNPTFGEAVFTTGMVGYPEALTDPSYTKQLLCFTYPLIGNYGVPPRPSWQSTRIHAAGVVIGELAEWWSHASGERSFADCLEAEQIPCLFGVDTRALTLHLRQAGTMPAAIVTDASPPSTFPDPLNDHLVSYASIDKPITYPSGKKRVIAVDYGMKNAILEALLAQDISVKRVPYDYDYSQEQFDGIFLSNGPGNPQLCQQSVAVLKRAMVHKKPIFGICLGSQLMALAAGATTYKLPYGHRGQNQPCIEQSTQRCFMTSQNHGFAVDPKSLSSEWRVTHINLNDGSVEGIAHTTLPFFSVQFHPEASPGPTDTTHLFTQFAELL